MTFSPPNTLEAALPENLSFAESWEEFHEQFTNLYRKVSVKVNGKERGVYPLALEILNDQQFFSIGNTRAYRSVFRKVFNFGAIAAGAALNVVHGITNIVEFTRIYGTATTNVVDYRPLPFNSVIAANQGVQLVITAANIVVLNGAAAPPITSGIIVVEYLKN